MTNLYGAMGAGLLILVLTASFAHAGETCGMMGGTCRDVCGAKEQAETGDFMDCKEKQECCVARSEPQAVQCCIYSFDAKNYGPGNCGAPLRGVCGKGSGSLVACEKLNFCK